VINAGSSSARSAACYATAPAKAAGAGVWVNAIGRLSMQAPATGRCRRLDLMWEMRYGR
jgi:hypothetical protein